MKHRNTKIIFQATFFLLLFASFANAQHKNEENKTIIINNGDTIINGKKLSQVSKSKQAALRKEFQELEKEISEKHGDIYFKKKFNENDILVGRPDGPGMKFNGDTAIKLRFRRPMRDEFRTFKFNNDTSLLSINDTGIVRFRKRMDGFNDRMTVFPPGDANVRMPNAYHEFSDELRSRRSPVFREKPNSQSFEYSNTDKDGISNRMVIHISDVPKEMIKQLTGADILKNKLAVEDLTVFPNFSTGKLTLCFNLATKGSVEATIFDGDFKKALSYKLDSTKSYTKQIYLPKNGIYYLLIKQGNASFIRRIIKE